VIRASTHAPADRLRSAELVGPGVPVEREKREEIPGTALREAVVNALVHRDSTRQAVSSTASTPRFTS